eukprot:14215-Eustigmatos_ZCMA.PRE.1
MQPGGSRHRVQMSGGGAASDIGLCSVRVESQWKDPKGQTVGRDHCLIEDTENNRPFMKSQIAAALR